MVRLDGGRPRPTRVDRPVNASRTATEVIWLRNQSWTTSVAPANGGAIISFDDPKGRPILRRAADPDGEPQSLACFPMVPFCGRIPSKQFVWQERKIELAPNLASGETAHGFGWKAAWSIAQRSGASLVLAYAHGPEDETGWPWPFLSRLKIELEPGRLIVGLSIQNTGTEAMPAALGLHPYLPARLIDILHIRDGRSRPLDGLGKPAGPWATLPSETNVADLTHCALLAHPPLVLESSRKPAVELRATTRHWTVYRPPCDDSLCIEPMTQSQAGETCVQGRSDFAPIEPGESLSLAMEIAVRA